MRIVPESNRTLNSGDKRSRLSVLGVPFYLPVGAMQKSRQHVVVRCDCGAVVVVESNNVASGRTNSCGCLSREISAASCHDRFSTHGESRTALYAVWQSMRARCENPKHKFFYRYGGRGITVCDQWSAFENFRQWAVSSGYRRGLTIDRKRNNDGYSPDNCEWITKAENTAKMHRDKEPIDAIH